MSSKRLAVGILTLVTLWVLGLGIERLLADREAPEYAMIVPTPTEDGSLSPYPDSLGGSAPVAPSIILGSRMADVDRLLSDWIKSEHGAGPGYFKYDRDIRLVIRFQNGVAVGVAALSLSNRPISEARRAELTRLVGASPVDANYMNGELHEVYFGDIW